MALGARPSRLVSQALTESILLSLLGGAAGLVIAFSGTRLILHFAFPRVSGLPGIPISASPSIAVLLFAFVISLLTGVFFGIAPAWMATRVDPIEALRGANQSTARMGTLPRKTLVVLQAAFSLVLLSTSGLLIATLHNLENQDFGFDQDRRQIVNINARLAGYRGAQLTPLYQKIHDAVSSIPAVSDVALAMYSPLSGNNWGGGVWVDGRPAPGPRDDIGSFWDRVTPGYFNAVGNRIIKGREISEQDTATSQQVAVINEAFARKFFKNEDPIGRYFGRSEMRSSRQYEIVGIARDARYVSRDATNPISPMFFLPEAQHDISPNGTDIDPGSHFLHDIVILVKPGASLSTAQLRQAVASVDPNLPVISVRTLREQVANDFIPQRLIARLTSFFGVLSLLLAAIGLYGVTAYNAGRRISEIGVRMALGADRGHIMRLVLRGAFTLILFGLLMGLPLTLAASRFLGNQLYGMNPYSPGVTLAAVVALGLSALAASLIPALRASLTSPLQALRTE